MFFTPSPAIMDIMDMEREEEDDGIKTICIFGISSMVGSNLAEFFKKNFRVVGTFYRHRVVIPGVLCVPCDILVKGEVQTILHTFRPDYTIYAIGVPTVMECSSSEKLADILNTTGLFHVAEYCQRYKSQVCYMSSHYVFQGADKDYLEIDMPDGTTVLGKTQAAAEFYIQKNSLNCLVFRCCQLYGRSINPSTRASFFERLQWEADRGEQMSYDTRLKSGFLDVYYLGMAMEICFERKVMNRLLHISSTDCITHYDFVMEYCRIFGYSTSNVVKAKWPFPVAPNESSPKHLAFKLDVANVERFLNIELPSTRESLELTRRRFKGKAASRSVSSTKGGGITYI